MEVKAAIASAAEFTWSNAALQYEARGTARIRAVHPDLHVIAASSRRNRPCRQISAHHPDCHSHRQGKLGHLAHSLCTFLLSQCFNELALVTPPPELALPVDWLSLPKARQASLKTSRCKMVVASVMALHGRAAPLHRVGCHRLACIHNFTMRRYWRCCCPNETART